MFGFFDRKDRLNELAEKGKTARVLRLVAGGADINQLDAAGDTPLLSALSALPFAHRETADALIAAGANVNCRRRDARFDHTPLTLAAQKGFRSTVKLLLKAGAEVNAVTESGTTALIEAAARNHTDIVRMLLAAGATVHHHSRGPLFYAYLNKNEDMVKLLLAAGATLNLAEAAECGQTEQVRRLLKNGADVNEGAPIIGAAEEEHCDIVRMLIAAGADVNAQNIVGNTALHYAALWGNTDIAEQLLAAGADANIANDWDETPCSIAVEEGHTEIIRLLAME
ncbi:MAG: ankyrin repeat domain-containing protein [Akkermansia sp.]|nr:ankyrin repeat domain-containing protein [Akkermansia sp.]